MRRIIKDFTKVPDILTNTESIETIAQCVANLSSKGYSSHTYGDQTVREALDSIYHGKCGYCESKVEVIVTPNIEHYRPLGRITKVRTPGYYWLGYEWSNLLLACSTCNSTKGTKFPLEEGETHVDHPQTINGDFDINACNSGHGHYSVEHPQLLNPECPLVDPADHLEVDEMGMLWEKNDSELGKCTIKEIELNRGDLFAARQKIANELICEIETALSERYVDVEPLTPYQFSRRLRPTFEKIVGGLSQKNDYTLMRKSIFEGFEEFILAELDEVFHPEVLSEYISFIEKE